MAPQMISRRKLTGLSGLGMLLSGRAARAQGNPTSFSVEPPELVGEEWLNTPGNRPLTLKSRRGKVTIVHFWTFG